MASAASEDSLLGDFIIAPSKSTSSANQTSSSGAVYRVPDEDQLSVPPYSLQSFPTADMTVQATISPHPNSLAQQANNIADISAQTATLKIKDMMKDKSAESHDMKASASEPQLPTAQAQTPTLMPNSTPDTLNINGVKYVKEQPTLILPAMMSVPGPSQNMKSGQSVHNTSDFTAGYLPITDQAELGNPTSTTAAPVNLQGHQAEHLAQQYSSQDAKGVAVAAAGGLNPASAKPIAISATGGPSTGRVINSYDADEAGSTMIEVLFDDGTSLWVEKDAMTRFFGKHADMFEGVLSQGSFRLMQSSAWAFIYLTGCIERRAQSPPQRLKVSKLPNEKLVQLYLLAKRFDHAWILVTCLQAIDPGVKPRNFVHDLKRVYDSGKADETFRAYFKRGFGACMLSHNLPVSMPPFYSNFVTTMLEVDGTIATDIRLALMDEAAAGAEPKPSINWGYDSDYDMSIDRSEGSESARRCRHCGGLPDAGDDWGIGPCSCGELYEPTVKPKKKKLNLPKSGRVETAPPSELGTEDWGPGGRRSYGDWEERASTRQVATPMNNAQRAAQYLHNVIEDPGNAYTNNEEWDGIPASSQRMEVASASAIANDGWTVNEHLRDEPWDAPIDGQILPVGNAGWDAESHQPAQPTHIPGYPRESAFHPRRQLQGPAPSSSSATPPPARRVLHTPMATRAPARVPDPPFHAPTPMGFGPFGHSAYQARPIGMPNYVHPLGYARQAHVGNGVMHPTSPGLYGLAGRTMVATRPSDGISSTLYFQTGDIINNVVLSNTHTGPTSLGYMLQGVCRGRHGIFPDSFVHDPSRPAQAPAPLHSQLASPFEPSRLAEIVDDDENDDDAWGTGGGKKGKGRANDKQAHVSDEEVSDDGADAWGPGPAEPRNDDWGHRARHNNGWDNGAGSNSGDHSWSLPGKRSASGW